MIFDYRILRPGKFIGRRFGKTQMHFEFFMKAALISQTLGDYLYPEMSKKHRRKLNETFSKYIAKKYLPECRSLTLC